MSAYIRCMPPGRGVGLERLGAGWVRIITSRTGRPTLGMKEVAAGVWTPFARKGSDQMAARGISERLSQQEIHFCSAFLNSLESEVLMGCL